MWEWLAELWRRGLQWVGDAIDSATYSVIHALQSMGAWLSSTFGELFRGITQFLSTILGPLLDLIGGLFYLLQGIVDVVVLIVQLLLLTVQVLLATIGGLFRSFARLAAFDPTAITPETNPYAVGTNLILDQFNQAGGDVLAAVLSWAVWWMLAIAVVRLMARSRTSE